MNKNNLLVRYDKDLRLRIMYPEARKEITKDVVRIIRKAPGMNVVAFTFANEAKLHDVIHQQLDYFRPLEQPFTWKVYDHDLLPSLKDKLISHGFVGDDDPAAVMVLDVKNPPALLSQPAQQIFDGLKPLTDSRTSFTSWTKSGAATTPGSTTGSVCILEFLAT